ncbi:MAG: Gfo/Idh/MocA family oxidoreductase [Acidobacteriia bacterium]|nr:Gfo/Idh/MocA family oxidoreductase [Terriglobia bacterium]
MPEIQVDRRNFLRGAGALTALSYSRVLGANDKIRLGAIGLGDRGTGDLGNFLRNPEIEVVAFCDIWGDKLDRARQRAPQAKTYADHHALLDNKEVDVVLLATPDHWHVPIAIDVLNSGRDLYVEKPLSLTPEEGPLVVKAARVNKRICQVGMQQRSGKHYLQAKQEYFDTGKIGKVTLSRTWWHGNSYHLRKAPQTLQRLPENLDWNRFLGRLKWRDWDPQQYYNWRAYLDFGGGQVTDLFTHWIDVVHMFTGQDVPKSASAAGGVYQYKDGRTAPDTINVLLEYPGEMTATFEATLVPGVTGAAQQFCGMNGRLDIDRGGYTWTPVGRGAQPVTVKATGNLDGDHINNFLECVKSRKLPNGDVLIGHRSAQASHLGNIAYVQKRRIDFDPQREEILPL